MVERKAPARKPRKAIAPEPPVQPEAPAVPEPHPHGYIGDLPDPTPNEHYTLSGVIADKPVPEHDR